MPAGSTVATNLGNSEGVSDSRRHGPDLHPEQEAFRAEARAWLAAHVPSEPLPSLDTAEGFTAHRAWERVLFEDRWSVVSWPTEYGGRDVGIMEWLIFEEEYYRARAPKRVSQNGIFLLAPTMLEYGTAEQKARFLPPDGLRGRGLVPGLVRAGRRQRPGRHPLPGRAQRRAATAGSSPARRPGPAGAPSPNGASASSAPTPKPSATAGLTYFLIPMDAPGVTVRPIPQIDGETGFAEIFFDNVEVPDTQMLGDEGAGWSVAMSTAGSERGLSLRSPARYTEAAGRLVDLFDQRGGPAACRRCRRPGPHGRRGLPAAHLLDRHQGQPRATPSVPRPAATRSSGPRPTWPFTTPPWTCSGPRPSCSRPGAPGAWLDGYLFALAGPIYAGTNEIQRNVVAERLLGLPRG